MGGGEGERKEVGVASGRAAARKWSRGRSVAGGGVGRGISGKMNSVVGEVRGDFVVSAEGRGNLGSEMARKIWEIIIHIIWENN